MLASEKMEELKTRKNCVTAGYGLFDRRVVPHRYAAVVPEFRVQAPGHCGRG